LTLRPSVIIDRVWRKGFQAELPEPTLIRCAAAISTGRLWAACPVVQRLLVVAMNDHFGVWTAVREL